MDLKKFLEIEKKYNLIDEKIDGFAYWSYFRYDLEWELEVCKNTYGEAHMGPARSVLEGIKRRGRMLWYAFAFHKLPKGQYDVLIFNHERRVKSGDYFECIYTDQIAQMYPDSLVLERPYFQKHFRPVKTPNIVYTDYIEVKAMLHYLYHKKVCSGQYLSMKQAIYQKVHIPIEEICREYEIQYSIESILEKMVCGYYIYQAKKKEFLKILNRLQPKVILEVVGYHMDCMLVNELAADKGIPTIELQHGITGKDHISYNYSKGTYSKQFPKFFFAFSDFWVKASDYPIPEECIKAVGFPHLEQKAELAKNNAMKTGRKKIIFISQGTIGEILASYAIKLNQMLDQEQFEIIYKLHPGEYTGWRERYRDLADSGIRVVDNNRQNLYSLFAEADYQIGAYGSTATFEGLYFQLKTYILREKAVTELKMLCENGIAEFFDSAEDLYRLISQNEIEEVTKIQFWKENALDNIKKEIDAIMQTQRA